MKWGIKGQRFSTVFTTGGPVYVSIHTIKQDNNFFYSTPSGNLYAAFNFFCSRYIFCIGKMQH